jgi:tetratricopeptide (TPR) repeat protein
MSQKLLKINLLLTAAIILSIAGFGCSSTTPSAQNSPSSQTPTAQNSPATQTTSAQNSPSDPIPSTTAASPNLTPNPTAQATPAATPGSAEDYFKQGLESAQKGDLSSAETAWRKSIELDPKNAKVHSNLGLLFQNQGKQEEATKEFEEAIRLAPKDPENYIKLAVILGQQKKLDESIAKSKEALRVKSDYAPAHVTMALALSGQGKQEEAVTSLKTAVDLFKKQGQTDQAIQLQSQLALALAQQKKTDEAIAQLQDVIKTKPDFAPGYAILGSVYADGGKPAEAVSNFNTAKDLFQKQNRIPQLTETTINLGAVLAQQNKLDESVTQLQEAIKLQPESAKGHYILAQVLAKQGKKEQAIASLTKLKEILTKQNQTAEAEKVDQAIKQLSGQKQ